MNTHEVARMLLNAPNSEIFASIDIATGVKDEYGDEIIAKIFGSSLVDVTCEKHYGATLLFELSHSGGEGVDVVETVMLAQSKNFYKKNVQSVIKKKTGRKLATGRFDSRGEFVDFVCRKHHGTPMKKIDIARMSGVSGSSIAKILDGCEGAAWYEKFVDEKTGKLIF